MPKNRWYVITGGPSTGKSTLLAELDKMGHRTLPESARTVIDNALAKGKSLRDIRSDERTFQLKVLQHKIQLETKHPKDTLIFFDRGMHDTLAYLRLHGFPISKEVIEAMKNAWYKNVFLLEPLQKYEDADYARTESREDALKLNQLLRDAYDEYGMRPITVPTLPLQKRVQFILKHMKEEQPA